jgi:hypothetical protein
VDPVTLIVTALVAGAAAGAKDTATAAIKEAYATFKSMIKKRLSGDFAAEVVEKHEKSPEAYASALKEEITAAGLDKDSDVLAAAQALVDGAEAAGVEVKKISQIASGSQNVQTADNQGSVSVSYGTPPPATGR